MAPKKGADRRNPLSQDQVTRAVAALLQHAKVEASRAGKSQLFDDEKWILMDVGLRVVPMQPSFKPIPIPLEHGILGDNPDVCIFTKDPQRDWKRIFASFNIRAKIVGLEKLRRNYKTYEAKRQLLKSYDLFLTDNRIVHFLPKLLGKHFFASKRHPIPVRLGRVNAIPAIMKKVTSCTVMFESKGPNWCVKVGNTGMSADDVASNVMKAIAGVANHVKSGWANVVSVHLKTPDSIALPVFRRLEPLGAGVEKAEPKPEEEGMVALKDGDGEDDDLSMDGLEEFEGYDMADVDTEEEEELRQQATAAPASEPKSADKGKQKKGKKVTQADKKGKKSARPGNKAAPKGKQTSKVTQTGKKSAQTGKKSAQKGKKSAQTGKKVTQTGTKRTQRKSVTTVQPSPSKKAKKAEPAKRAPVRRNPRRGQ